MTTALVLICLTVAVALGTLMAHAIAFLLLVKVLAPDRAADDD